MKKGFTLIELLAVILILGIISLIAIPVVNKIIEESKKGAVKNSGYGISDAVDNYYATTIKDGMSTDLVFTCVNNKCTSGSEEIKYNGSIDRGEILLFTDGKAALCIEKNNYYALKNLNYDDVIIGKGTCGEYDTETQEYETNALVSKEAYDALQKQLDDLNALIATTDATASDIKQGKKAYTSSGVVTGTNNKNIILLGTFAANNTIDVKSYGDYENFTVDNFLIVPQITNLSLNSPTSSNTNGATLYFYGVAQTIAPGKTYNQSSGILSIQVPSIYSTVNYWNQWGSSNSGNSGTVISVVVYLINI